jgi:hypothetical protein
MAATPTGRGYWLVASDGGIFSFGDATFEGAGAGQVTAVAGGRGYALSRVDGKVMAFRAGTDPARAVPPSSPTAPAAPTSGTPAPEGSGGASPTTGGGSSGGSTSPASTTTTTAPAPSSTTTAPAATSLLWSAQYDLPNLTSVLPSWMAEQEPAVGGVVQKDRITTVAPPAGGSRTPGGNVMRVELRPYESAPGRADGDVTTTSGYSANRAEVYARHATPRTTPATQWPDPVGSTRWYGFDLFVPNDFVFDTTGLQWFTFTQWKGLDSGSPPIALELKNDHIDLGGASGRQNLGPVKRGQWERIVVGVHFDPSNDGWVEVYRDGVQALGRTHRPTMNMRTVSGTSQVDPSYLKQGIYRSKAWQVTHVLYFGTMAIGESRDAVL